MNNTNNPTSRILPIEPARLLQLLNDCGVELPKDITSCIKLSIKPLPSQTDPYSCKKDKVEVDERGCRNFPGEEEKNAKENQLVFERVAQHFHKMQHQYAELMPKVAYYENMSDCIHSPDFPLAYKMIPLMTILERLLFQAFAMEGELLSLQDETYNPILSDIRFWRDGVNGALDRLNEVYIYSICGDNENS